MTGDGNADPWADLRKFMPKSMPKAKAPAKRRCRKRPWVKAPFFAISYADVDKMWVGRAISPAGYLMRVIDELAFGPKGENPLPLTPTRLARFKISYWRANQALRKLEAAGVITVEHVRGRCPIITPLWKTLPP